MLSAVRSFSCAIGLALMFGCGSSKEAPPDPASAPGKLPAVPPGAQDVVVQPRFSGGESASTEPGTIGFTITKVHPGHKAIATAPFHAPGGTWTYVEAHLDADPAAAFVFGIPAPEAADGPVAFASFMFAPTTRVSGDRVISRLARGLATPPPAPRSGGVLQAVKVPAAMLGTGIGKLGNGMGGSGTWDATKLFCSVGDIDSAELFFNYSLTEKRGEFSEKDSDYNKDVVACLATILRDGKAPPRTPENDPTLAAAGPRLVIGKNLGRRVQRLAMAPDRVIVGQERGDSAAVLEVDVATGAVVERMTTPDRVMNASCDATLRRCVIDLSPPGATRNVVSSKDERRLVLLDGTTVTPLVIPGGENPSLGRDAISPDGRFVVVMTEQPDQLVALDLTTKKTFTLPARSDITEVVAWSGSTAIVVHRAWDEAKPRIAVEWRLGASGAVVPSKRESDPPPVSPDGKRTARFGAGTLTVRANGADRTLTFHAEDAGSIAAGCCTWIDNRWMAMPHGFIDTDAMKVTLFALDAEDDVPHVDFIPGTRTALVTPGDGLHLATAVGP